VSFTQVFIPSKRLEVVTLGFLRRTTFAKLSASLARTQSRDVSSCGEIVLSRDRDINLEMQMVSWNFDLRLIKSLSPFFLFEPSRIQNKNGARFLLHQGWYDASSSCRSFSRWRF